jgi:hypothetical protein
MISTTRAGGGGGGGGGELTHQVNFHQQQAHLAWLNPPIEITIVLQIHGNIANIFGKFVREGKATIRFKQPTHELCLSKVSCINKP